LLREAARSTYQYADFAAPLSDRDASPDVLDRVERVQGWAVVAVCGDNYALVEVGGEVDIAARPKLTEVLRAAVDSGKATVIIDLSAVALLSAAGIGCLQNAANLLATRGGQLHLVCPAESSAARALRLLDLHDNWPLIPTAVAMLKGDHDRH
jgi:anti-anti-sigma factor